MCTLWGTLQVIPMLKDRNEPAKCALCSGPHPANYKGCLVHKDFIKI